MNVSQHLRKSVFVIAGLGAAWALSCSSNEEGASPIVEPGSLSPALGAYCRDDCALANDGKCDEYDLTCAPGSDCTDCGGKVTGGACEDTCRFANDGFCDSPLLCTPGTDCSDCAGLGGEGGSSSGPTCQDTCENAVDGRCDEPDLCEPGTDCTDCRGPSKPTCKSDASCGCDQNADCLPGSYCDAGGECALACLGMQCGTDHGVSCGTCAGANYCSSAGQCVPLVGGISAMVDSSCAWKPNGTVACWGRNDYGQLGNGTKTDRPLPTVVAGLNGVTQVLARDHTCVVNENGTMSCWGRNDAGQLGNGKIHDGSSAPGAQLTPGLVSGLSNVTMAAAGAHHTCALKRDKTVACWGSNMLGLLGDGTTVSQRTTPVSVVGLSNVAQITAGFHHTCALLEDRTVKCWGIDIGGNGAIGDNGKTTRSSPVSVTGLTNVRSIASGIFHTCAVRFDGTVACWGENADGEVGSGAPDDVAVPTTVPGLTGVASVAVGLGYSCARKANGAVACWGSNSFGKLGDGTTTKRLSPVTVSGLTDAEAIAAGNNHACAMRTDGTFRCWGANPYGQIGDGTGTTRLTPVSVLPW